MNDKINTSWVWQAGNGMHGATLNTEHGIVEWFDMPGCSCGGSGLSQTYEQFMQKGSLLSPPEDVIEEMRESIQKLSAAPQSAARVHE